jgi:3'-phosphoadenosine 5'-phosphosulfate sulfotransferase (PAPS reductase)/FAD synthetase
MISRSYSNQIIDKYSGLFTLPGDENSTQIIPCSGGKDSICLILVMTTLFPKTNFLYYFSDTAAESPDLYQTLDDIEDYLGIKIIRDRAKMGLFDYIDKYKLLMGGMKRWCTTYLKLIPFESYIKRFTGEIYTYVGIRADENRTGLMSKKENVHTILPFKDFKINANEVFEILSNTIGIPKYYNSRTRSACIICPYQRQSELIGAAKDHYQEYMKGANVEKLAIKDQHKWKDISSLISTETGFSNNHYSLPYPSTIFQETFKYRDWGKANDGSADLFRDESVELWALAEFFVHPQCGVWYENIVTYSESRGGVITQLKNHFQHRIKTAEVFGINEKQMKSELKYVIYRLNFDANDVDISKPASTSDLSATELEEQGKYGCYTFKQNNSYQRILYLYTKISRCLYESGIDQTVRSLPVKPRTYRAKQELDFSTRSLKSIKKRIGEIVDMQRFQPTEILNYIEDEENTVCLACSL